MAGGAIARKSRDGLFEWTDLGDVPIPIGYWLEMNRLCLGLYCVCCGSRGVERGRSSYATRRDE